MAQARLALVGKVGIRVCRRTHGFVEGITLAHDSSAAKATDAKETGLTEARGRLGVGAWCSAVGAGRGVGIAVLVVFGAGIDAEELPEARGEMAFAVGVLCGRHPCDVMLMKTSP